MLHLLLWASSLLDIYLLDLGDPSHKALQTRGTIRYIIEPEMAGSVLANVNAFDFWLYGTPTMVFQCYFSFKE